VDSGARNNKSVDSTPFGLSKLATFKCVEQLLKNDKVDPGARTDEQVDSIAFGL